MNKIDFLDNEAWIELAQVRGLRLPQWRTRLTTGAMRQWLRKLNVSVSRYLEWEGGRSLGEFTRRNPMWPLRAWVGVVMEAFPR